MFSLLTSSVYSTVLFMYIICTGTAQLRITQVDS